jgi:hypothetical protein
MPPRTKLVANKKKRKQPSGAPSSGAKEPAPVTTDEGLRPPTLQKPAVDRKNLKETWLTKPALLVMEDGVVFMVTGIRKPNTGPWEVVAKSVAAEPVTKAFIVDEVDGSFATQGVKQIIAGCVGGAFKGDGHEALVYRVLHTTDGPQVEFGVVVAPGKRPVGDPVQLTLELFIEKYIRRGRAISPSGDEPDAVFNYEPYPRLMDVLRVGGAFVDDNVATMSRAGAAKVMLAMKDDEGNASETLGGALCDLDALALDLESMYSKEQASPAISKLRGVVGTGSVHGLDLHARGKLIRQLVLPVAAAQETSPAQPATKPKSATLPSAPSKPSNAAGKRKQLEAEIEELLSDDGSDSDNSDDDEETAAETKRAKALSMQEQDKNKRVKSTYRIARQQIDEEDLEGAPEILEPMSLMSATPAGMSQIEAARIIFSEASVRAIIAGDPVPDEVSQLDTAKIAKRCDLMYRRLVDKVGTTWRPIDMKPPRNAATLSDWAEHLLDQVARGPSMGAFKRASEAHAITGGSLSGQARGLFENHAMTTTRPAEGLSGAKLASAVTPTVALALFESQSKFEGIYNRVKSKKPTARCEDVMAEIGDDPADLRLNLTKAMRSNGLVDAAGITTNEGRSLPPYGHGMRRTMLCEVENSIREVADADTTGEISMDAEDVATLAAKVAEASDTFNDFETIARKALGQGAAKADTYQALSDAWAWMQPALRATLVATAQPQREFAAIAHMAAVVNAPPGLSRLSAPEIKDWIEKVKREYKAMMRAFRMHDGDAPSWHVALEIRNSNFQYKALRGALGWKADQGSSSRTDSNREGQREKKAGTKGAGKPNATNGKGGAKAAQDAKTRTTHSKSPTNVASDVSAWKERTASLSDSKFKEVRDAAKEKFKGVCNFFLVAKCSRGKECRLSHDRPAEFEAFLAEHGVKLNGEVRNPSLASTRQPARVQRRASSPPSHTHARAHARRRAIRAGSFSSDSAASSAAIAASVSVASRSARQPESSAHRSSRRAQLTPP